MAVGSSAALVLHLNMKRIVILGVEWKNVSQAKKCIKAFSINDRLKIAPLSARVKTFMPLEYECWMKDAIFTTKNESQELAGQLETQN